MKKQKENRQRNLLPFEVIRAASSGNVGAIQVVLKHYEGYIAKLATRKFFDEYGHSYYCVDEALRKRLETKLITKVLDFKIA